MPVMSFTRWKSREQELMREEASAAKQHMMKAGAQSVEMHRFHSGAFIGEWLVVARYANWEAYGKAQDALTGDAKYQALLKRVMEKAELVGRSVLVDQAI
ncbi:hypothetical protein [Falsiroseomonas sp. HW251]|uniref:hypothetical protein n=1 Tax=Falsiroseomonas sp. HW251 TaxID=3390998 RepID=UPI003D31D501